MRSSLWAQFPGRFMTNGNHIINMPASCMKPCNRRQMWKCECGQYVIRIWDFQALKGPYKTSCPVTCDTLEPPLYDCWSSAEEGGYSLSFSPLSSSGLDRPSLHPSTNSLYNFHPALWTTHLLLLLSYPLFFSPCQRSCNPAGGTSQALLPVGCLGSAMQGTREILEGSIRGS